MRLFLRMRLKRQDRQDRRKICGSTNRVELRRSHAAIASGVVNEVETPRSPRSPEYFGVQRIASSVRRSHAASRQVRELETPRNDRVDVTQHNEARWNRAVRSPLASRVSEAIQLSACRARRLRVTGPYFAPWRSWRSWRSWRFSPLRRSAVNRAVRSPLASRMSEATQLRVSRAALACRRAIFCALAALAVVSRSLRDAEGYDGRWRDRRPSNQRIINDARRCCALVVRSLCARCALVVRSLCARCALAAGARLRPRAGRCVCASAFQRAWCGSSRAALRPASCSISCARALGESVGSRRTRPRCADRCPRRASAG